MASQNPNAQPERNFGPTTWAINNRSSLYLITAFFTLYGLLSYNSLPKEQFPEVVVPTILVYTVYPGTSPADMENLVTRPIEKELKGLNGVKRIQSKSMQDFGFIQVEFNTTEEVSECKDLVKDAVDKAKSELPNDMPREPDVREVNFSEIPVVTINLSGDYDAQKLKKFAEDLQDEIEGIKQVTRVDIVGALDREIQINVDMYRMQAANISFGDIESAIARENVTVSGGNIDIGNMQRALRVVGEFDSPRQMEDVIVRSARGAEIRLGDIATIEDAFKKRESYARLDGKPVVSLNVIKRAGENLIETIDQSQVIIKQLKAKGELPENLKVTLTGDQSRQTRTGLSDLINSIVIGFILVVVIIMFFMGINNALLVATCIPLSAFITFIVINSMGYTLNIIVLFTLLLALGILVDNSIVVVENIYRIFDNGKRSNEYAAKYGAAEVFIPVLGGVATNIAPFFPLLFWPGITGKFMYYIPVVFIIVMAASMVVAFLINPVFQTSFMKVKQKLDADVRRKMIVRAFFIALGVAALGFLIRMAGSPAFGSFVIVMGILFFLSRTLFDVMITAFQERIWPRVERVYVGLLKVVIKGRRPVWTFVSIFGLLFLSFVLIGIRSPKTVFFPESEPNFIYAYIELPVGSTVERTDSVTRIVEQKITQLVAGSPIVESVIANVAVGAGDPRDFDRSTSSHKGKVTVTMVEYGKRDGVSSEELLTKVRESVKGMPGVIVTVEKEQNGPPIPKPINIEIAGDDFHELAMEANRIKKYLDSLQIAGIEELKSDLELHKPEIIVEIDRDRANREGISTGQIGMELRTAVFGKEISKFRDDEDEYPIQLRYSVDYREDIDALMQLKITFMDMATGRLKSIPLSSVAKVYYSDSYGSIKRKNVKRVVTLSSEVTADANANEVVANIKQNLASYTPVSPDVTVAMTGAQEDQEETANFLGFSLMLSVFLIIVILVMSFNSFGRTALICLQILFSIIGVLLGFALTGMDISIVMTGVGIITLAGVAVNNGIILIEFIDLQIKEGKRIRQAVLEAGLTRLKPVMLTTLTTIFGLVPMAVGFNIDFYGLLASGEPHIYLGGDSVAFWGPLSWTMIYGLTFTTVLTLVCLPAFYLIYIRIKQKQKRLARRWSL